MAEHSFLAKLGFEGSSSVMSLPNSFKEKAIGDSTDVTYIQSGLALKSSDKKRLNIAKEILGDDLVKSLLQNPLSQEVLEQVCAKFKEPKEYLFPIAQYQLGEAKFIYLKPLTFTDGKTACVITRVADKDSYQQFQVSQK
jgi:hypothetical protein